MSEKVVNYTSKMVERLNEVYVPNPSQNAVMQLAEELNKSPASIRAKLSSMGVYVPKARTGPSNRATKANLVAQIAKTLDVSEESIESLEKVNKNVLERLLSAL